MDAASFQLGEQNQTGRHAKQDPQTVPFLHNNDVGHVCKHFHARHFWNLNDKQRRRVRKAALTNSAIEFHVVERLPLRWSVQVTDNMIRNAHTIRSSVVHHMMCIESVSIDRFVCRSTLWLRFCSCEDTYSLTVS